MKNTQIKIYIYYRDLPLSLSTYIQADGNMSLVKDGVKQGVGHACPRATLYIDKTDPIRDEKRLDELLKLLVELENNNQIVGHATKRYT